MDDIRQRNRDIDTSDEVENEEEHTEEQQDECPECSGEIVFSENERICESCGLIIEEETVDRGPEWRAFDHKEQEEKSRVGSPTTQAIHDKGLTTTIDWKNKDAYGQSLSSKKRSQMHRLRKWQNRIRTKDAGERNLQFALSEIDRMGSALGVPRSVRTTASVIYRKALDEDLIRGRSIEGVSTAALYAACRQEGIPRSLEEIANVSRVKRKEIGRTYSYISKELNLEMRPVNPKNYIPRYCTELELDNKVEVKAKKIVEETADEILSGKDPTGFAAAAVYTASLLCDDGRTQREVAEVAKVTEVTIRNRYQEQIKSIGVYRGLETPEP
jgi:transcription initiation factor TFIIB